MVMISQNAQEKAEMKVNDMKTSSTISMGTEINFVLRQNRGHTAVVEAVHIQVVRRLLWFLVGQAGRQTKILPVYKSFKILQLNSKACLGCLNGYIVQIASYQIASYQ